VSLWGWSRWGNPNNYNSMQNACQTTLIGLVLPRHHPNKGLLGGNGKLFGL
jgi:hypothetical protein